MIDRTDDDIATVTAKIWYVSDFHGKYTQPTYAKVDESCVDNPPTYCDRVISEVQYFETIPEDVRNSWEKDTPHNRAQAVVNANLDYMNEALANSDIPIRYVQWGTVQDIGKTEQESEKMWNLQVSSILRTRMSETRFPCKNGNCPR